jgi:hypothetical protein
LIQEPTTSPSPNPTGLVTGCEVTDCGRPVVGMLEVEVSLRGGKVLGERARTHQIGLCDQDLTAAVDRPPTLHRSYHDLEGGDWRPHGRTYR